MIKRLLKDVSFLLLLWASLSLLLIFCIACFRINGYIAHPQHGYLDNFYQINDLIAQDPSAYPYFLIYFILDIFWAATLLLLIDYILGKGRKKTIVHRKKKDFTDQTLYRYIAPFALYFDILEGIMYLSNTDTAVKLVVYTKITLYIICFVFLLYALLKEFVIPNVKSILRFLVTSLFSIFFILIVYVLVMAMPQGGTLVVELFYSPINMVLLFFSLTFLTIMISHYPVYNDIWLFGKPSCVELKMSKLFKSIGLGIIYYNTINHGSTDAKSYNDQIVKNLRRSLGILLYVALYNIFLSTGARYFEFYYDAQSLTILILLIVLVIYYRYGEVYNSWKRTLDHPFASTQEKKKVVNDIIRYVSRFPAYFILSTLFVIGMSILMYWIEWSRLSFILVCVALGLQMFLYIYFKIARTYFKYVFYSECIYNAHEEMYNKDVLNYFKTLRNRPPTNWILYQWTGHLSNNVKYLVSMRLIGIVSFIIIVIVNLIPEWATYINPINIIILYLALYYSIAMIIFKHILYYHRTAIPDKNRLAWEVFRYGIPVLLLLVGGLAIYFATKENDLHQLSMVEDTGPMPYRDYVDSLLKNSDGTKKQNVFFVGSYGGGLKANLWNLLLFHELERLSAGKFMENTLVLSGVSGGAVGIGNYASLVHNFSSLDKIDQQITIIGRSNVLSGELTYLLGKDWIREYMPFMDHKGTDRSYISMAQHAEHTGMCQVYNEVSYHDYWKEIYGRKKGKFPALIMNSTSVSGKQGVASTVQFPEGAFPAADKISLFPRIPDRSITYYGAVSTTNRFPLFSPTAKIENKGNYLDGGYFENSGMLSALSVFDALASYDNSPYKDAINPIFVNVINSQDYYIAEVLRTWNFETHSIAEAGEFSSILGTVMNIDKLPRYISEKIRSRGYIMENITMPHKITYESARTILKAEVTEPLRLIDSIEKHNAELEEVLKAYEDYDYEQWGFVQPPLARVLSKPAVMYERAMVECHDSVRNTFNRILDYLNADTKVDADTQKELIQDQKHRQKSRIPTIKSGKLLDTLQ